MLQHKLVDQVTERCEGPWGKDIILMEVVGSWMGGGGREGGRTIVYLTHSLTSTHTHTSTRTHTYPHTYIYTHTHTHPLLSLWSLPGLYSQVRLFRKVPDTPQHLPDKNLACASTARGRVTRPSASRGLQCPEASGGSWPCCVIPQGSHPRGRRLRKGKAARAGSTPQDPLTRREQCSSTSPAPACRFIYNMLNGWTESEREAEINCPRTPYWVLKRSYTSRGFQGLPSAAPPRTLPGSPISATPERESLQAQPELGCCPEWGSEQGPPLLLGLDSDGQTLSEVGSEGGKGQIMGEDHSLAPGRPGCPMKAKSLKARGSRNFFGKSHNWGASGKARNFERGTILPHPCLNRLQGWQQDSGSLTHFVSWVWITAPLVTLAVRSWVTDSTSKYSFFV